MKVRGFSRLFFAAVPILLGLSLGASRDLAVPPPPGGAAPGQAWLYVIGINDYLYVQKLTTAVADAQAVRDQLIEKYQFDRAHLIERYDRKATREAIIQDLYDLAQKAGADDSLFIYYAGHGYEDRVLNQGYWVPVDGQVGKIASFVSNNDIQSALSGIPARHIWLVSDSCFSGTLLAERALGEAISERYYREKYRLKSRQVLASGGKEPVADASGNPDCRNHSVFACYFLKRLKNNDRPYLTPVELFSDVAQVVANNSGQTPVLGSMKGAGDELGEFVLISRAAGLPPPGSSAAAPLPEYAGTDIGTLQELEDRARQREEAERQNQAQLEINRKKYLADLDGFFSKASGLDAQAKLTPAEKAALWKDFLAKFPENHPQYGQNPKAGHARERQLYWEAEARKLAPKAENAPVQSSPVRNCVLNNSKNLGPMYSQQCQDGDQWACACVGLCVMDGRCGYKKDPALASSLAQKACDAGENLGCAALGECYYWSKCNLPEDNVHAAELAKKSCEAGEAQGCLVYSNCLSLSNCGLPKNFGLANQVLQQSCEAGLSLACTELGRAYLNGTRGVNIDNVRAVQLFQKACNQAEPEACGILSAGYRFGNYSLPVDMEAAGRYVRQACDGGYVAACYFMATCYELGECGLSKDLDQAEKIYQTYCSQGEMQGCNELGRVYRTWRQKEKVARQYFQQACDGGYQEACKNLRK